MKKIIFTVINIIIIKATCINAQEIAGMSFNYTYLPVSSIENIKYNNLNNNEIDTKNLKVESNIYESGIVYPFFFNKMSTVIINKLYYKQINNNYIGLRNNQFENIQNTEKLFSITYSFEIYQLLSKKWNLISFFEPTYASSNKTKYSTDAYSLSTGFGFEKEISNNYKFGFGVFSSNYFGKEIFLPFIYCDFKFYNKLQLISFLPKNINITYKINSQNIIGINSEIIRNIYYIENESSKFNELYLYSLNGKIATFWKFKYVEYFYINFEIGCELYSEYKLYDNEKMIYSINKENSMFVKIGFEFGI